MQQLLTVKECYKFVQLVVSGEVFAQRVFGVPMLKLLVETWATVEVHV